MANLSQNDLKKGVLKGTNETDIIEIDANPVGYMYKKITVKAGNGNDNVDISNHFGKFYVYAGMGSDTLSGGKGENYLYGESGTNTFKFGNNDGNTVINAGKGKAIIDFSSVSSLRDEFFEEATINDKFKRNGNDLIIKPKTGYSTTVTIKDFYKSNGEFIIKYQIYENSAWVDKYYDLRDLHLTTNIEDLKSANYTGGRLDETIIGDERNNTIKGGDGFAAIYGGDGNDKLYGGNSNTTNSILNLLDYIRGGEGNDTIYGNNGYNSLEGNNGNDVIYGGDHYDTISGGLGDNKLYGGKGNNTYIYSGGNDTIYLEKDSETKLILNNYEVDKKIKKGNDVVVYMKNAGTITLKNFFKLENYGNESFTAYKGASDSTQIDDWFGYDKTAFQASGKGTIKGTVYNDDIYGSEKADKIYAYAGNDSIDPNLGNDKIYAADSYSTIFFKNGDGNDTIYGGYSNLQFLETNLEDLKYERVKDDLIIKYTDNDSVTLSEYFNHKTGCEFIYDKNDNSIELYDFLESYNNKLEYTGGNVKFYSMPNSSNIVNLDGFNEDDFINAKVSKKGNDLVFSNLGSKKNKITVVDYYKNGIDGYIYLNNSSLMSLSEFMYYGHGTMTSQKFNGTIYNDVVKGTDGNDVIKTKDGHDTINSSMGDDIVYAGSGNDVINYLGGSGHKKVYGEAGNDSITAYMGNDTLYGGDGNDTIYAKSGDDKVYGDKGNDYLYGEAGNDTIDGGAGNDWVYGGIGNDSIKGGAGDDVIYGDEGNNTIYGGAGNDNIYINNATDKTLGDLVHGDAGNDNINIQKGNYSKVYGDAGNDTITVYGDATSNEIYGGAGNDYINVQAQYTGVDGGAGNDTINIKSHYCEVKAGSGNDIIRITGANTEVDGGSGNDTYELAGGFTEVGDSAGNDKYVIDSIANSANVYVIDDSKGKDTLIINYDKEDITLSNFNVQVNQKGKIVDLDDIDVHFSATGENGSICIEEYFGSGCIERIETADGYYITKAQMQNVAQEVAAWLVENNFYNVGQCMMNGNDAQKAELTLIYENINWQQ